MLSKTGHVKLNAFTIFVYPQGHTVCFDQQRVVFQQESDFDQLLDFRNCILTKEFEFKRFGPIFYVFMYGLSLLSRHHMDLYPPSFNSIPLESNIDRQ